MMMIARKPRALRGALLCASLCLVASCGRTSHDPWTWPVGHALVSSVAQHESTSRGLTSYVDIYGADEFTATKDLTLVAVDVAEKPEVVSLLAARVGFLRSSAGRDTSHADLLGACISYWPAVLPSWSFPVQGLKIHQGEKFTIMLYVRASRSGEWHAQGVKVAYRLDSGASLQQTSKTTTDTMVRWDRIEDVPRDDHCIVDQSFGWASRGTSGSGAPGAPSAPSGAP